MTPADLSKAKKGPATTTRGIPKLMSFTPFRVKNEINTLIVF
jgi:hypothetical protein